MNDVFGSIGDLWENGSGLWFPNWWMPPGWFPELWFPAQPSPIQPLFPRTVLDYGLTENDRTLPPYARIDTVADVREGETNFAVTDLETIQVALVAEKQSDARAGRDAVRAMMEDADGKMEWPTGVQIASCRRTSGGRSKKQGAWIVWDRYEVRTTKPRSQ